jgi:hypothetical protein
MPYIGTRRHLLFNFARSARSPFGDITEAEIFHGTFITTTFNCDISKGKVAAIPFPDGLKRIYIARAGNVSLELADKDSFLAFQQGRFELSHVVDHVVFREGFCSLYLVDKQIHKKSFKERRYAAFG